MNVDLQQLLTDQDDRIVFLANRLQDVITALEQGMITAKEGAELIKDIQRYTVLIESSISLKRRMILTNLITEIIRKIEIGIL